MKIIIFAISVLLLTTQAQAQRFYCGKYEHIVKNLKEKYGEVPRGIGIINDQQLIQLFVSEETGTWTLVRSIKNGPACFLGAGQGWQTFKKPLPGKET